MLCLVQHIVPCDVHGRPHGVVSFLSWWVLGLLTLGLVTAPAVSTEHRCYLDIPFACVDSMLGSHGHSLLS